jgi:hypothetical protein
MKLLIVAVLVIVLLTACRATLQASSEQACLAASGAKPVTAFGLFSKDDIAAAPTNTETINTAIARMGQAGGGIVCLPSGTYHLTPPNLNAQFVTSVWIDANNVTLWGAGMDGRKGGTRLRTRSDYSVIKGKVMRGVGIWIKGTQTAPRTGIVLRDFELDGGSGFSGNFDWPANTQSGDGWDITHKGIILSVDDQVDNVLLERVWVHSYKGEVIYAGGAGMGRLILRNIRSEDTNASTYNATAAALVEDSYFGKSRFWIEIGTAFPGKSGIFRKNTFQNAQKDVGAIALAQGDGGTQPYTFEDNRFENCNGGPAFYFGGGVGGFIHIRRNVFTNCGGIYTGYAESALPSGKPENQNIVFENNTLQSGGFLAVLLGTDRNVQIRHNTFSNPGQQNLSTAVVYCCGNYQKVVVANNVFKNMRSPERSATFTGERPLFVDNTYDNIETRESQGGAVIYGNNGYLQILFEQSWVQVVPPSANGIDLEVVGYPDGQETTIVVRGGSLVLPAIGPTYELFLPKTLKAGDKLKLRFSKTKNKWIETP